MWQTNVVRDSCCDIAFVCFVPLGVSQVACVSCESVDLFHDLQRVVILHILVCY